VTINQVINTLELHGATVTGTGDDSGTVIHVNGVEVLIRCSSTPNTHTCIELFHESSNCKWIRSWGLTSLAQWLLHQDCNGSHYWYYLPTLKEYVSAGITNNTLQLMNNSTRTRERNDYRPNTNVMAVWIDPNQECDYRLMYNDGAVDLGYKRFLADVVRLTSDDYS
jgi:hypothetical protein